MHINDIEKIEITSFDHQGRGLGRIDNMVVFVPNTLPGEIINVKLTNKQKNYLEGEVVDYITKSSDRVEPLCLYYATCGGCDLMHISYPNQLKYKEDKIKNIMSKYANIDCVNDIVKCNRPWNYRNKVTFQVDNKIGLYEKRTNSIIPIDKCLLADPEINKYFNICKSMSLDGITQVVIRTSATGTMVIFKCTKNIQIDTNLFDCNVIIDYKGYHVLKGNDYIIENIGYRKYKISPSAFFQVNSSEVVKLYDKVKEYLDVSNDNILDLYCGTGTIGIYVSNNNSNILGIEINESAIKDANENKKLNNLTNISFMAGDTAKILKKIHFKPNKVIVDPPRAGLDKKVIEQLLDMKTSKIVYVSCDPITLARDLKLLSVKYTVDEVTPIDMFPNTYHVETVVLLSRKSDE